MPTSTDLAAFVEAALREGRLPARKADRMFGGTGIGATCSICRCPIPQSIIEYEMEFAGDDRKFHVHIDCYTAWERRVLAR